MLPLAYLQVTKIKAYTTKAFTSFIITFFCLVLVCPAHAFAPFGEFTIKDEAELGKKFATLIRAKYTLIHDPEIVEYVRGLVQRISKRMQPQPFSFKVNVIKDKSMNAFAAPAGQVFVNSGLILNLKHESELAAVLAHELAHVSQRHIARKIQRSQLISLGTLVGLLAGAFLGSSEAGEALTIGSMAGAQSVSLKYSREDEREADELGLRYLVRAGFAPMGMVRSFERIRKNQWLKGGGPPPYLSTHPGVEERITALRTRIESMRADINPEDDDRKFHRVQTLLSARFTDPATALSYFEKNITGNTCLNHLGKGIVFERENEMQKAKHNFDQALECNPKDPLFLREAGRFYFFQGNIDKAGRLLQESVFKKRNTDQEALFYLARVLAEKGEKQSAVEYFKEILRKNPRDPEVHYYLGRTLGQMGHYFSAHLHLSYSELYNNNLQQFKFHLQKAEQRARDKEQEKQIKELKEEYKQRKNFLRG